jgi:transcription elongation GreA/GreB family factor
MASKAARSKAALKTELLAQLEAQLEAARTSHAAAAAAATDDEARPENDQDTRGLEQSYLARGHAQRVADLEAAVASIGSLALRAFGDDAPIAITALVEFEDDKGSRLLWLVPHGGGLVLAGNITVVTPTSPLGKALLGRRVDDEIELAHGGARRTLTITAVG